MGTERMGPLCQTGRAMPFDEAGNRARVAELRRRGVDVWGPERVYVDQSVQLDRIEPGAVIRQASLSGPDLSVASGAEIGTSGHAELNDCQIGPGVQLGSGLYTGVTMLERAKVRGFAEIRAHTLLEEQAEAAHNVALKNTTFTACCVAGSLINFCDLFLSGGTSREDHTEVGSGAIHYNFDPRGDKWGSLIGGIRSVVMRSPPVFIGGHCGIVGPVQIGLGAITAAGSTIRTNVPEGTLYGSVAKAISLPNFDRTASRTVTAQLRVTAHLIATLHALDAWYRFVRIPHAQGNEQHLYKAARRRIRAQISERIERLDRIVERLRAAAPQKASGWMAEGSRGRLVRGWPDLRAILVRPTEPGAAPAKFLETYSRSRQAGRSHLAAINESEAVAALAERWLDGQVTTIRNGFADALGAE